MNLVGFWKFWLGSLEKVWLVGGVLSKVFWLCLSKGGEGSNGFEWLEIGLMLLSE